MTISNGKTLGQDDMTIIESIRSFGAKRWNQLRELYLGNGINKLIEFREKISTKITGKILMWSFQPTKLYLNDFPIFNFADLLWFPIGALCRKYPGSYLKLQINYLEIS